MVEDTGQIREAIEATRADIAETMEALGQKADVKTRLSHGVKEKADEVKTQVTASAEQFRARLSSLDGAAPDSRPASALPAIPAPVAVAAGIAMMFLLVMARRRHRS